MRCKGGGHLCVQLRITIFALLLGTAWAQRTTNDCRTEFDNVQARALSSQYVIVGKVTAFLKAASGLNADSAYVLVENVVKSERPAASANSQVIVDRLSDADRDSPLDCISSVKIGTRYIMFMNASSASAGSYTSVKLVTIYTKKEYSLLREVSCAGCATAPTAKTKKLMEVSEGTTDYRFSCRAESPLLANVTWYKNGLELPSSSGVHVSHKERNGAVISTLRFRRVRISDAGNYSCSARNALGNSSALTKFVVLPRGSSVGSTPTTLGSTVSPTASSHYVVCTDKDSGFCLHGGLCRIRPNGHERHCLCQQQYTGRRCEETSIDFNWSVAPWKVSGGGGDDDVIKSHVITALATVLGIVLLGLCGYGLFCSSRRCNGRRKARAYHQEPHAVWDNGFAPLCEVDGPVASGKKAVAPTVGTKHLRLTQTSLMSPLCTEKGTQTDVSWAPYANGGNVVVAAKPPILPNGLLINPEPLSRADVGQRRSRLGATATPVADAPDVRGIPALHAQGGRVLCTADPSSVGQPRFLTQEAVVAKAAASHSAASAAAVVRPCSQYEPGAVDNSSESQVTHEIEAICDWSSRTSANDNDDSYDVVGNMLAAPRSTLLPQPNIASYEVLDALLDQLQASG